MCCSFDWYIVQFKHVAYLRCRPYTIQFFLFVKVRKCLGQIIDVDSDAVGAIIGSMGRLRLVILQQDFEFGHV